MRKKKIIGILLVLLGYSFWLWLMTSNPTPNSDIFILAASECVGLGLFIFYGQIKVDHPQDDNLDEESDEESDDEEYDSLTEDKKIKITSIGAALIIISAIAYYIIHVIIQPHYPMGAYFYSMCLSIPLVFMLLGIKLILNVGIKKKDNEMDTKIKNYWDHAAMIWLCFFIIFIIGYLCIFTYKTIIDIKDSTKIEENCIYAQINYIEHTNGKTNVYIEYKSGNTKKEEIIENYKESVKEGDWIKVHCKKTKKYTTDISVIIIEFFCLIFEMGFILCIFDTVICFTSQFCIEIFLMLKELF